MRIVVIFMMLLMVSIAGVSLLASTTLKSGTEAIVDFANTARAQSQPLVATPIPAPREEASARPPGAPVQPAPTVAPAASAAPVAEGESTAFVVRQGETTGSIAERLTQTGLVAHPTIFRFWVQWKGAEGRLQAGEYRLRQGMSMDEIIDAMLTARARDVAVTFVEGRRLEEYAEILQGADVGIEGQRFLELAKRGNFAYDFLESKPPGATLEGYLFPDTYRVIPGKTTAEELIHQMLKRFGETLPPQVREQAQKNTGLNVHQTVILASIVEREAQVQGRAPPDRRRLHQSPAGPGVPLRRRHHPVRHRQGARVVAGAAPAGAHHRAPESLQHLHQSRTAPGPDRQPRGLRPAGRRRAGEDSLQVLRPQRRPERRLARLRPDPGRARAEHHPLPAPVLTAAPSGVYTPRVIAAPSGGGLHGCPAAPPACTLTRRGHTP